MSELLPPQSIPLRSDIPESDRWDLTPLFPSPEDWEKSFQQLQKDAPEIARFRGELHKGASILCECLEFQKTLDLRAERLGHFAMLQVSEDSSNQTYLERQGRLMNFLHRMAETASFIEPEIQQLDDATFSDLETSPELAEWRIVLGKLRRFKPHTLSEREERLLALAAPVLNGPDEIFGQLVNVDMKFGLVKDESGRDIELSHGGYSSFLQKRDRHLRKTAFDQYYAEFEDHKFTLAASLEASVKGDVFRARARNYRSAVEAALFPDAIPLSVYDQLIAEVRANLPALHDYFELRREWLKLPDIHFYDTYVPVVDEVQMKTSFDEAAELVLAAVSPLGCNYVDILAEGFHSRWVDRYENKGKRSGAFSSSSYGNPPFILMNYKEDVFADVYTLAHEAGHSMHSHFSMGTQRFQDAHYPIFLAEVASTFNEELLTHHLLQKTDDPRMRAYILNRQIDDIRGTVFRQTMFAEFERVIHEMEEAGEALTLDAMTGEYRKLLEAYFGPHIVLDECLQLECLRIPHFYSAFYVYKYATGMSAAVALSEGVLEEREGAVTRYLDYLKMGGSLYPLDALRKAGVDMESPAPVRACIDLFRRRLAELTELLRSQA